MLFDEVLSRHLTLRGVIRSSQQWQELRQFIKYKYVIDSHFNELKGNFDDASRRRFEDGLTYMGKYFSEQYVRDSILKQSPRRAG